MPYQYGKRPHKDINKLLKDANLSIRHLSININKPVSTLRSSLSGRTSLPPELRQEIIAHLLNRLGRKRPPKPPRLRKRPPRSLINSIHDILVNDIYGEPLTPADLELINQYRKERPKGFNRIQDKVATGAVLTADCFPARQFTYNLKGFFKGYSMPDLEYSLKKRGTGRNPQIDW